MKYIITPQNANIEGYCYSAGCPRKCGGLCAQKCAALGNGCESFCFKN